MAEAFTIIGLAANIVKFIMHGIKIISTSMEASESARGMTKETVELDLIVQDIEYRSREVLKKTSSIRLSDDESAIQKYATNCGQLARELQNVLDKLTIRKDARSRLIESGRVAVQSIRRRKEMLALKTRLHHLDDMLRSHLSNVLQEFVAP